MAARGNRALALGGAVVIALVIYYPFILISGAILPQILLNVPLTITLLTHGAALLFLLWYATPRTMFEPNAGRQTALAH
jgi:hypothetical protein